MSLQENTLPVITATVVAEDRRMGTLPRFFGRYFGAVENSIFDAMGSLCEAYNGGFWHFYELSNDAFFMAPATDGKLALECPGNYFKGELSAEAAGIVATLFGLCRVAERYPVDQVIDRYHALRDFALDHPEAGLIMAAID